MTGKEKCRILRKIRNEVAIRNGIEPFADTCTHTGECAGTCPKCEAEVRMLSKALKTRRARRKRVALAGVGIGVCAALTGCALDDAVDAIATVKDLISGTRVEQTMGEVEPFDPAGEPEEVELAGDVAMPREIEEDTGEAIDNFEWEEE